MFKGPDYLGNGLVFPGGDLREPPAALARAHAFVLTGSAPGGDGGESDFRLWLTKEFPGRPVFAIPYRGGDLQPGNDRAVEAHGAGAKLLAFCGLARPETFRRMLLDRGHELTGFRAFPDHHPYSQADLKMLERQAEITAATALVTTAKDLVKLRHLECPWPLYVLPVELQLPSAFTGLVRARL
jgi:tetraacyldisaccharide 4'-kinase